MQMHRVLPSYTTGVPDSILSANRLLRYTGSVYAAGSSSIGRVTGSATLYLLRAVHANAVTFAHSVTGMLRMKVCWVLTG